MKKERGRKSKGGKGDGRLSKRRRKKEAENRKEEKASPSCEVLAGFGGQLPLALEASIPSTRIKHSGFSPRKCIILKKIRHSWHRIHMFLCGSALEVTFCC